MKKIGRNFEEIRNIGKYDGGMRAWSQRGISKVSNIENDAADSSKATRKEWNEKKFRKKSKSDDNVESIGRIERLVIGLIELRG